MGGLYLNELATVNSVSSWSRTIFTELGGTVYITQSSQKYHLYAVQNMEGIPG